MPSCLLHIKALEEGTTQEPLARGLLALRAKPLSPEELFTTKKLTLSCSFHSKWYPFHIPGKELKRLPQSEHHASIFYNLEGLVNEDTLLPMMFLGLRKLGNICCGHKLFLNKIKHFLCSGHKICVRNKCCARRQMGKHLWQQQCVLVCQGL